MDVPEPPWWTPRKATTRRHGLSRAVIVEAGRRVLRAEGIDALSMRRIAAELDTGAASLYAHVASKDELLELLLDDVIGEVTFPEIEPRRWKQQLLDLWIASRDVMVANGDIARVLLGRVPAGPNALRMAERCMALMRAGAIPDQAIAWGVDVVGLYVTANAVEGSMHRDTAASEAFFAQLGQHLARLPAVLLPVTVSLGAAMMTGDPDERFRFGLGLLVDGLAALAPDSPVRSAAGAHHG